MLNGEDYAQVERGTAATRRGLGRRCPWQGIEIGIKLMVVEFGGKTRARWIFSK